MTQQARKQIAVTGAAGLTGRKIIERLSARGAPVRALVRDVTRPAAAALAALPHVELAAVDLAQPETLVAPLRGVDRVMLISSSDPDMLDVQSNVITAARRAGARCVVKLSGILPDLDSPFRFARMHGEIEQRLEASGLAYTHLRGGEFMTAYFRQVPSIVGRGVLALPMADARIASLDVDDLADVAAHVLTTDGHDGRIYRLTGPAANTMTEVAAQLSAAIGKPVRYVDVAPEDAQRAQLAAGVAPYLVAALAELFAERRAGKEGTVFADLATLLGRRATSFTDFAERNAAIFRGEQPAPKV